MSRGHHSVVGEPPTDHVYISKFVAYVRRDRFWHGQLVCCWLQLNIAVTSYYTQWPIDINSAVIKTVVLRTECRYMQTTLAGSSAKDAASNFFFEPVGL